ncbi:MAG: DUF2846 domain-containing protein [Gammaproteobacteria bacterium]|nr:DUF2846 domain-containing protein [Gammaproteobacteria bacterium]MCF6231462.1 DUF2846 domain-containing protein [Gammaproteobacteria bacterium]
MKNNNWTATLLVITSTLVGCSASGPKFVKFNSPSDELASVYFYRPSQFVGSATSINIMEHVEPGKENDDSNFEGISVVGKLRSNSYFRRDMTAGEHKFTTNWMFDPLIITLYPGRTYCFKTEAVFLNPHPPLNLVDNEKCQREIMNTDFMTEDDINSILY